MRTSQLFCCFSASCVLSHRGIWLVPFVRCSDKVLVVLLPPVNHLTFVRQDNSILVLAHLDLRHKAFVGSILELACFVGTIQLFHILELQLLLGMAGIAA